MFLKQRFPQKLSFKGKYASFKNIKFPRGNYQPIVKTNTLLSLLSLLSTTSLRIYLSKFPTAMERLGVSYFLLCPLQMILHLYMYKQFYMWTVDLKEETFQRGNLESQNLCTRLTFYCIVVHHSLKPKKYFSCCLLTKIDMKQQMLSMLSKKIVGESCLWSLMSHHR